jgi:hypothetical protein
MAVGAQRYTRSRTNPAMDQAPGCGQGPGSDTAGAPGNVMAAGPAEPWPGPDPAYGQDLHGPAAIADGPAAPHG